MSAVLTDLFEEKRGGGGAASISLVLGNITF